MKKLDSSQIAGLVANAGIIISILFLAYELRQNTITARSQASQGLQDQIAANLALTTNPMLADIVLKGNEDPTALSALELAQFNSYWTGTFSAYENMYFQVVEGNYDSDRAAGWWQLLRNLLGYPGAQVHWESRQFIFSPEFVDYVNHEVLALDSTPGYELGGLVSE